MVKVVRVHDPSVRQRRLPLNFNEETCPGLLQFFSQLEYRTDTALVRGVLYQWYLHHRKAGTLEEATSAALAGPGGLTSGTRKPRESALPNALAAAPAKTFAATESPPSGSPTTGDKPEAPELAPIAPEGLPLAVPNMEHLSLLDTMF